MRTGEKTACLERQEPAGIPADFKRFRRGPGGKAAAWTRAAADWYGFLKSYEIFSRLSSSAGAEGAPNCAFGSCIHRRRDAPQIKPNLTLHAREDIINKLPPLESPAEQLYVNSEFMEGCCYGKDCVDFLL